MSVSLSVAGIPTGDNALLGLRPPLPPPSGSSVVGSSGSTLDQISAFAPGPRFGYTRGHQRTRRLSVIEHLKAADLQTASTSLAAVNHCIHLTDCNQVNGHLDNH